MAISIVRNFLAAMLFVVGAAIVLIPATAMAENQKLVIQVSDNDSAKWDLALNNARSVQAELGKENVEIEIIAFGPGIRMLMRESTVGPRLAEALGGDITLLACENTMRNTKIGNADLYQGIGFVNAGVTHIMKRQREGWVYVRP